MKKAATATTTTTAPPLPRSAALTVLTSGPLLTRISEAALARQPIVRLGQVNKATHALANDAELMDGLWKRLYEKDWSCKLTLEAEAVLAAAGVEGSSEDEDEDEAAAATTTTTTTATTTPSWKELYINRHKQTLDQPTYSLQNKVEHGWAFDEWKLGEVEYARLKGDELVDKARGDSDYLTHAEMEHIAFNGFVFRYLDGDWKPTGNETDPATSDVLDRASGTAPEDALMAQWVSKQKTKVAQKFLKAQPKLRVAPPNGGGALTRRRPSAPEVYYAPKGYLTIGEMCRILWLRSASRPNVPAHCWFSFNGLHPVHRQGQAVAWRMEVEDTGT